jgi:hypothetical protein
MINISKILGNALKELFGRAEGTSNLEKRKVWVWDKTLPQPTNLDDDEP